MFSCKNCLATNSFPLARVAAALLGCNIDALKNAEQDTLRDARCKGSEVKVTQVVAKIHVLTVHSSVRL